MIRDGKTISDGLEFKYQNNYLYTSDEVITKVSSKSINNTLKISDECNISFKKELFMPKYNTENSKERISIPQNPNALTIRKNDRNKIIFGSVLTLHTFDRDLKWNPHILCLVCEEAFDTQKNKMKNFSFISYEKLRKTWMYQVLDLLSKQKIKNFRYLKQKLYEELVNGFYVYAKKRKEK